MECLFNYIGLKYSGMPIPKSGRYLNDLAGMSTELLDNLANSEMVNFVEVWNKIQKRAIDRLRTDVLNIMAPTVTMKEIVYQTRRLSKSTRNPVLIPKANVYRGVYIMLPESKYSEFRENEVYFYSYQAGASVLKIWDLNDGTELYSKDIEVVVGYNSFDVTEIYNLKYRIQEFYIGIDCSLFDTIQTDNDYYYWYNGDESCAYDCNHGGGGYRRGFFQMYAGTLQIGADATYDNILKTGIGQGVALGAEIGCSIDQYLCDNKKRFSESLLYVEGAETMLEKLGSSRMNFWTSSNLKETDELRSDYENRYIGTLKRTVKAIPLEGDNVCFDCDDQATVSTRGMMP